MCPIFSHFSIRFIPSWSPNLFDVVVGSGIFCDPGTSRPLGIQFCVGVICWCLLLLLFVTFPFSISCLALSHKMDPQAFWRHEGKLFMAKREVVNRGWLSDAQSSKKLKGQWKKASSLGMHLSAKYSGAREPTFADADIILPTVVFGKCEEAPKMISDEKLRLCARQCYVNQRSAFVFARVSY